MQTQLQELKLGLETVIAYLDKVVSRWDSESERRKSGSRWRPWRSWDLENVSALQPFWGPRNSAEFNAGLWVQPPPIAGEYEKRRSFQGLHADPPIDSPTHEVGGQSTTSTKLVRSTVLVGG